MARITYVKHARARFEMVPKLDDQGNPVVVPVLRKDGTPKKTKRGREVTRNVTVQDRSKPLPNFECQKCGTEILPGMPYKWIEPKMRGMMVRCMGCPNWQVWEYSYALHARVAEIQYNAEVALSDDFESPDDVTTILGDIAGEIRDLASEKEEAASNMEEGFGHETYQSQEIAEQADQLNGWADEVENATIPELPEPEEADCSECDGTGKVDNNECDECSGAGQVTPDDPTDEQMDEWREEARAAAQEAIENCPV